MAASANPLTSQITVSPTVLNFPPPLNRVLTHTIKISNASPKEFVSFRVKTTAPTRYCVRPNMGIVSPNEFADVAVMYNPVDPPPAGKQTKDRFQIQLISIDPAKCRSVDDLKEAWGQTQESQMVKMMLKCRFKSASKPGEHQATEVPQSVLNASLKSPAAHDAVLPEIAKEDHKAPPPIPPIATTAVPSATTTTAPEKPPVSSSASASSAEPRRDATSTTAGSGAGYIASYAGQISQPSLGPLKESAALLEEKQKLRRQYEELLKLVREEKLKREKAEASLKELQLRTDTGTKAKEASFISQILPFIIVAVFAYIIGRLMR